MRTSGVAYDPTFTISKVCTLLRIKLGRAGLWLLLQSSNEVLMDGQRNSSSWFCSPLRRATGKVEEVNGDPRVTQIDRLWDLLGKKTRACQKVSQRLLPSSYLLLIFKLDLLPPFITASPERHGLITQLSANRRIDLSSAMLLPRYTVKEDAV